MATRRGRSRSRSPRTGSVSLPLPSRSSATSPSGTSNRAGSRTGIPPWGGLWNGAAFLADGRTLLVSSRHGIRVWDLGAAGGGICDLGDVETGRRAGPEFETRFMATAAIGPGGRVVADGDLSLDYPAPGRTDGPGGLAHPVGVSFGEVSRSRRTAAQSPARPRAARSSCSLAVRTGRVLRSGRSAFLLGSLAFSPDGKRLAVAGSGSKAATIYLWDVSDIADRMPPQEGAGPRIWTGGARIWPAPTPGPQTGPCGGSSARGTRPLPGSRP